MLNSNYIPQQRNLWIIWEYQFLGVNKTFPYIYYSIWPPLIVEMFPEWLFIWLLDPLFASFGRGAEFERFCKFDCAAAVTQWTVTDWTHSTSLHAVKSSKLKRVLGDGQAINLFNVFQGARDVRSFAYLDFCNGLLFITTSSMRRSSGRKQTGHFCFCSAKWGAKLWPRFALNLLQRHRTRMMWVMAARLS